MPSAQRFAPLFVAALLVAGAGACSSSDDASTSTGDSSTTTAAAGGGGDSSSTTTAADSTTTAASGGGDISGTWRADAGDILAANTANVGAPTSMTCTGPVTLTFNGDGTFVDEGQVNCTVRGMSGSGQFSSSGNYSVDGSTVTITGATSTGQLTVGAANVPFSPGMGDGSATFQVAGNSLTLSFDGGSAGQLSQTYTR